MKLNLFVLTFATTLGVAFAGPDVPKVKTRLTTLPPDGTPKVTARARGKALLFKFAIPSPATGPVGATGATGTAGATGAVGPAGPPGTPASTNRQIYVPGLALSHSGAGVTPGPWGLTMTASAAGRPTLVVPQPPDWDKTQPFTVTLYYSFPNPHPSTFVQWRILAGSTNVDLPALDANSGWDSFDFNQSKDATASAVNATVGRSNTAKTQSWTATYSSAFDTYYIGTSVTTNNDFSHDPLWQFSFQRGGAAANTETYAGDLTINGVGITYQAK